MGLFNPHASNRSLFGIAIPDFGITEAISSAMGGNRTAQGGSNLFGGSKAQTQPKPTTQQQPPGPGGAYPVAGGGPRNLSTSAPVAGNSAQITNPFAGAEDAARSQSDAALGAELSALDYNKEQLGAQTGQAEGARSRALSSLGIELEGVKNQVGKSRQNSIDQTNSQTQDALGTAQDVQRQNRNTLRALGILGSTAAGELLQKPMNEYDKQRGRIQTALTQRLGELDDFLNQKVSEHKGAVENVEAQYASLIENIQRDLRFNDRQRLDAVKSANAALQGRLADIQQSMFQWNTQVETMKKNFAMDLAKMQAYKDPNIDVGALTAQVFTPGTEFSPQTVGLAQDEQKKKGLLSGSV